MIYEISLPIAFVAGLVSFLAPCVIPLLPAYIAYVTGVSFSELKKNNFKIYRKKIFISGLFYVLGFSLLFTITGTAAASISGYLIRYQDIIRQFGGIVIIILGLQFSGILKIGFLSSDKHFNLPQWTEGLGYLRSFIIGVVFAMAWSPCVGAIYGSILSLAAVSGTATTGAMLLFVYSLGISIPFIIVTLSLAYSPKYLKRIDKHFSKIAFVSGLILVIIGILLLTNTFGYLNRILASSFF